MKSKLMNLYLNQLYNEEYDPMKTLTQTNPLYRKTLDELNKIRDTFYKTLSKEDQHTYDDIIHLQYSLTDIENAYTFSEGFKIAYQINLEVYHQFHK